MTVPAQTPIVRFTGNDNSTVFSFAFESIDSGDIYVQIDGVVLTEGIEYELEDYNSEEGGLIVIPEPLPVGSELRIYRQTPVTQELDLVEGQPFPANAVEQAMDKDTYILQEMIEGGRSYGGPVDLTAIQEVDRVTIDNSAGLDAGIPLWDCDGAFAGVFAATVLETGAPLNGEAVPGYADGHIFFELGDPTGIDSRIVMNPSPLLVERTLNDYILSPQRGVAWGILPETGQLVYGDTPDSTAWPTDNAELVISPPPTGPGQYVIRILRTNNLGIYRGISASEWLDGEWFDFWNLENAPEPEFGFRGLWVYIGNTPFDRIGENIHTIQIARDDGTGNPELATLVEKVLTHRLNNIIL